MRLLRWPVAGAAGLAIAAVVGAPILRRRMLDWGATPEDLAVGDVVPVSNDGTGLRVRLMEPQRVLGALTDDGTWAWTWVLEPDGDGTRLLSRTRMSAPPGSSVARLGIELFLVPASWVMERRMLLGLRERAEGASVDVAAGAA